MEIDLELVKTASTEKKDKIYGVVYSYDTVHNLYDDIENEQEEYKKEIKRELLNEVLGRIENCVTEILNED